MDFSTKGVLSISKTLFSFGGEFSISLTTLFGGLNISSSFIFLRFSLITSSYLGDRFRLLLLDGRRRSL